MPENTKARLLKDLFLATRAQPNGVSRRGFLARHPDNVKEIENLIASGEIQYRDGKHLRLPLLGLNELARVMHEAESVRYLCAHLFDALRSAFIDRPDAQVSQSEIATLADMPEQKVAHALGYLLDAPIFDSWSTSANGFRSQILISDRILQYQTFADVVDAMHAQKLLQQSQDMRYTQAAARAVYAAIEELTATGKRAYVRNVPLAAENILIQWGKGRVTRAQGTC